MLKVRRKLIVTIYYAALETTFHASKPKRPGPPAGGGQSNSKDDTKRQLQRYVGIEMRLTKECCLDDDSCTRSMARHFVPYLAFTWQYQTRTFSRATARKLSHFFANQNFRLPKLSTKSNRRRLEVLEILGRLERRIDSSAPVSVIAQSPIMQQDGNQTNHNKTRKLGHGYSLALNAGPNGLHVTLVYFHKLRRGYEQNMVKTMCRQYFDEHNMEQIPVTLGPVHEGRSVQLVGPDIEEIVSDLGALFASFDIAKNQVPHVDLRGQGSEVIPEFISTIDNFYI